MTHANYTALGLLASIACVAALVSGCTHAATIETRFGYSHRGTIIENDGKSLVVEDAYSGKMLRIPDADVVDIRHPGTVEMVIGGTLAVGGTAIATVNALKKKSDCSDANVGCGVGEGIGDDTRRAIVTASLLALTVPGIGMVLWGSAARTDSVHRAEPKANVSVVPVADARGAALHVEF